MATGVIVHLRVNGLIMQVQLLQVAAPGADQTRGAKQNALIRLSRPSVTFAGGCKTLVRTLISAAKIAHSSQSYPASQLTDKDPYSKKKHSDSKTITNHH